MDDLFFCKSFFYFVLLLRLPVYTKVHFFLDAFLGSRLSDVKLPHDFWSTTKGYQKALACCQNLFIFHSQNDSALNGPYYLTEASSLAFGLIGPKLITNNSAKVKVINVSDVLKGYSDYISLDKFYNYLLKIHNRELDSTENHFILS